jgi:peptide/nickel transport system ATP-binding protein
VIAGDRSTEPLLQVSGLTVELSDGTVILDGVDLSVGSGEFLGIVGESGAGKSMSALAVMQMLPRGVRVAGGRMTFAGDDLATADSRALRQLRGGQIGMVFQDPLSSLNPVMTVGNQIEEALRLHGTGRRAARERTVELLALVGIREPATSARSYPHEFSGGMRQRVTIAIAVANNPRLVIADEPTTGLDTTIQKEVLALLTRLRDELGLAVMLITHDIGVVEQVCDRVTVMRHGRVVETADAEAVFAAPRDRYTMHLIQSAPRMYGEHARGPENPEALDDPVVSVVDLEICYRGAPQAAVDGVTLSVSAGRVLGLIGESGSGKTSVARAMLGLVKPTAGQVMIGGVDRASATRDQLAEMRPAVQFVFQDSLASMDPRWRVRQIVSEPVRDRKPGFGLSIERLLEAVGLDQSLLDRYPDELSGGQRQRVGIARALASGPRIIVADEPVSSLDVSVQAQVLDLLCELRDSFGVGLMLITHDLAVAWRIADEIAVMHRGRIVEHGPAEEIMRCPTHAYTAALLAAAPGGGDQAATTWQALAGGDRQASR